MSIHYQVYVNYQLTNEKQRLLTTSIFSTKAAFMLLPLFEKSPLNFSRIFPTLEKANSYIDYLKKVYPHSLDTPPEIDNGQIFLFKE